MGRDTIVRTHGVSFTILNDHSDCFEADDGVIVLEVLRRLRYISRQFSISRTYIGTSTSIYTTQPPDPVKLQAAPAGGYRSQASVSKHYIVTALTDEHIEHLAALSSDFSVPVHADVLLDALEAHAEQDFRKALLYAAIAVEALASTALEAAAATNVDRDDTRHRIVSLLVNANNSVRKDPISSLLLRGENFARLLHEAPLYILGRSLLVDRQGTYQKALRLYSTRNKIAHLGAQPDDEEYFAGTAEGSAEALGVAVDVFEWFGDAGPYVISDGGFVSLDDDDTSAGKLQPERTTPGS